uniref:Uncharacterized protein n=1 Tax=Zooxanthella nutricula TaxID=1333877 RepID=A0A6U8XFG0_9DINO|mmetsp:Transcript_62484/g.191109  ORF Transcript_62484/g.191109 Transcript_62484/m.191109 type:complete len:199 (+) Transcript_62484:87-683(+)
MAPGSAVTHLLNGGALPPDMAVVWISGYHGQGLCGEGNKCRRGGVPAAAFDDAVARCGLAERMPGDARERFDAAANGFVSRLWVYGIVLGSVLMACGLLAAWGIMTMETVLPEVTGELRGMLFVLPAIPLVACLAFGFRRRCLRCDAQLAGVVEEVRREAGVDSMWFVSLREFSSGAAAAGYLQGRCILFQRHHMRAP